MHTVTMVLTTGIYLLVIGSLAYLGYKKTIDSKDYLIAGRDVHPFLMATAYGSTFISTAAIVGFGGMAAKLGMGLLWLVFANIFLGVFVAFVVFGKRTAEIGRKINAYTFPEFLGRYFDSDLIRRFTAGVIVLVMPIYTAAVMIGASRFVQETLGVDYRITVLVFAFIVGAYVITGGLKGVMYTDAVQGTIMLVGMLVLLVYTYNHLGGVTAAHQALTNLTPLVPEELLASGHQGWTKMPVFGSEFWWVMVTTLIMGVGIGVLAQPQLVVRFLTVRGARELNRAVIAGGLFILLVVGVAYIVGALTNVYFYDTAGLIALQAATDGNIDTIVPLFINTAMPEWFSYVFMLTLLAAGMSTLSGQFHTIGSAVGHDLFQRPGIAINRLGILVTLAVTVVLCFVLPAGIVAVATATFFAICAATFLPTYVAALFWEKVTKQGALASMFAGLAGSVFMMTFFHAREATAFGIAQALFGRPTLAGFPWTVIDPIVFSLPLSALVLVLVSYNTQRQAKFFPAESEGAAARGVSKTILKGVEK